ncbi:gametogenetin-binding protein 1-like isoform X1 [Sus scrofa]|uniref:gametogenetin-binding protein 1-like isoform X1 n=1 Tax=Sus scrofa TaxID=9823 RepID=UPI0003AEAA0C|nr:gametogenetin-binding protein 1-like isoform X1 [Sus scrofa]
MEAPAPTPRAHNLGRSSMFRLFRSLVGGKGSPESSDQALVGGQPCPLQEQDATPLMTGCHGAAGQKESWPPASLPCTLAVALPRTSPSGLELGDAGAQTPTPVQVLRVVARGVEVRSDPRRGGQEALGSLSEMDEREEEEVAGAALGDTGTSDRGRFAQALEVDQGCLQRAAGPLEVSPKALAREEEECLLDGELRLASSKVGATPWSRLLSLYKQLQKSAMTKFPLKEGSPQEDKDMEEEMEDEDSSFKLCVPGIVTLPSPLRFVESELKKLLVVQRESRLWKTDSPEGWELLAQPEVTLEEAGIVDSQGHQVEGEGSHLPAFGECWGPGGRMLRQRKQHPRLEGRVRSPLGAASRTEHLLLDEMDEMENWLPE